MPKPEKEKDQSRFDKLKRAETERGRDEETAADVAAREVEELRKQEGRARRGKENPAGG